MKLIQIIKYLFCAYRLAGLNCLICRKDELMKEMNQNEETNGYDPTNFRARSVAAKKEFLGNH